MNRFYGLALFVFAAVFLSHCSPVSETERSKTEAVNTSADLAACISEHAGPRVKRSGVPRPLQAYGDPNFADVNAVAGYVGYHTTWRVGIDWASTPPVARDLYEEDALLRLVFDRPVPQPIVRAVKACGLTWQTS